MRDALEPALEAAHPERLMLGAIASGWARCWFVMVGKSACSCS